AVGDRLGSGRTAADRALGCAAAVYAGCRHGARLARRTAVYRTAQRGSRTGARSAPNRGGADIRPWAAARRAGSRAKWGDAVRPERGAGAPLDDQRDKRKRALAGAGTEQSTQRLPQCEPRW